MTGGTAGSAGTAGTAGSGVSGQVADGWEPVRDAFAATVDGAPGGAAVALVVAGRTVVDLWAGSARPAGPAGPTGAAGAAARPWSRDTRALVFSASKGLVALCVLHLVQSGHLDLDAPVAACWPEFAQHGKGTVTLREALAHRAGVPVVDAVHTRGQVLSWEVMAAGVASQVPLWPPGTAYQYHALTYGWLAGECLRRVAGRTPGRCLHDVFGAPLGLRTAIGVPVDEQSDIATVLPAPPADPAHPYSDPLGLDARATSMNGALVFPGEGPRHDWNDPDVLAAEIPAGNGVSSARDLATLYAAVVGTGAGAGLIADDVLRDALTVLSEGQDVAGDQSGPTPRWGAGIMAESAVRPMFGPTSFGHDGAGGQVAFGDIATRSGFAYVTSQLGGEGDTRANDVVAAARRLL